MPMLCSVCFSANSGGRLSIGLYRCLRQHASALEIPALPCLLSGHLAHASAATPPCRTQFCLTMAVVGCLDHWEQKGSVLYIDTERKFSSQR